MKVLLKYLFPPLFGLLIYATIRIINDTVSGFRFWKRDWSINAIEIIFSILMGYLIHYAFRKLFQRFDRNIQKAVFYKTVLNELLWVIVVVEVSVNAVITPMAALTDDGLSWGDVATINIIPLLYCLIYYAVVRSNKLLQAYVNNKLQLEKLSNDHLQTELKFLKAQYHPHFLFNALNTVYFQMDESVPKAKESIEKLSELLRYQLYDQQQTVPLKQEFDYLRSFIELQKTRSSEKLKLSASFDESLNGGQVYPLLFLPLVENAFKYVGGDFIMNIEARSKDKQLHFKVENSVPAQMPEKKVRGIGLENLKRRLELLYPGKHSLHIENKNHRFTASLKLEF